MIDMKIRLQDLRVGQDIRNDINQISYLIVKKIEFQRD